MLTAEAELFKTFQVSKYYPGKLSGYIFILETPSPTVFKKEEKTLPRTHTKRNRTQNNLSKIP